MAIRTVDALVLRRLKFRETSLLVTFFARESGKFVGLLKGIRDPKRPRYGSPAELFSLNHVVYYERRHGEIHTVAQCDLAESFRAIRASVVKTVYASYLMEALGLLTETRDPHPEFFDAGLEALRQLVGEEEPDRVAVIGVLRLLALSGVRPSLASCVRCGVAVSGVWRFSARAGGVLCAACVSRESDVESVSAGAVASLDHVAEAPEERLWRLRLPSMVLHELRPLAQALLAHHVGRVPRSQLVLEQIVRDPWISKN